MSPAEILDQNIRSIAKREREALAGLIAELREVDLIRGYEELGI